MADDAVQRVAAELLGARRHSIDSIQAVFEAVDTALLNETNGELKVIGRCAASQLAFVGAAAAEPVMGAWLRRRSTHDFRMAWLTMLGLTVDPFTREHPTSVPGLETEISNILDLLIASGDVIRVQGDPGVGKSALLLKLCEALLSQQLVGRSVLPCYVPNLRTSARQFAVDILAGAVTRHSCTSKRLAISELAPVSLSPNGLDAHIVLPTHLAESACADLTADEILQHISSFVNRGRLALVLLLDDVSGKVRGPISATQLNTLTTLQQQCEASAVIAVSARDKALPRTFEEQRRGDITLWGIREPDIRLAVQAFYRDARDGHGLKFHVHRPPSAARIYDIMIRPWEGELLGEAFAEDREGAPYYMPRRVKRMAALMFEHLSSDASSVRFAPKLPTDVVHVKQQLARTL
jgi:hypothetical protein